MPSNNNGKLKILPVQVIEIENGIILKRGCQEVKFSGEAASELLKVLLTISKNGASRNELCRLFRAAHRQAVQRLIDELVNRRMLVPLDSSTSSTEDENELDVFYWHFGMNAGKIAERLNRHSFVILGVNCISRQVVKAFAESGLSNFQVIDHPFFRNLRFFKGSGELNATDWSSPVKPLDWTGQLELQSVECLIATCDFGGLQLMREWNVLCVNQKKRFMPIVLQNLVGYVGPLVLPGETACFECFRARRNAHLENAAACEAVEARAFDSRSGIAFHPSMASVLADIAVLELTKFYSGVLPMTEVGTQIEVNLLAMSLTPRKILKIPRCAVCSPLSQRSSVNPERPFPMSSR